MSSESQRVMIMTCTSMQLLIWLFMWQHMAPEVLLDHILKLIATK